MAAVSSKMVRNWSGQGKGHCTTKKAVAAKTGMWITKTGNAA
jgi:hypothetical protein